jgi:hypothetical protein
LVAQLAIYAKPSHLHRYRPLGDAVLRELHALRNGYIFCPNFSNMNDPMEGTYRLSRRLSSNAGAAKSPARVQAALEAMGIASLSEVYDHETMWAHYANKFKGMCVQYSLSRLLKGMSDEVAITRMLYSEREPVLLNDRSTANDRARLCLSSKTVRWSSEREWRLFKDEKGEAHYGDVKAVTKIFLGARIAPLDEEAVRDTAKGLQVPVVKMSIDAYAITFKAPFRLRRPASPASS